MISSVPFTRWRVENLSKWTEEHTRSGLPSKSIFYHHLSCTHGCCGVGRGDWSLSQLSLDKLTVRPRQVASSLQGLKMVYCVFSILYVLYKYLERNHQDKHLVTRFISVRGHCSTAAVGGSREGARKGALDVRRRFIVLFHLIWLPCWECCRLFIGPHTPRLFVVYRCIGCFGPVRVERGSWSLLCF